MGGGGRECGGEEGSGDSGDDAPVEQVGGVGREECGVRSKQVYSFSLYNYFMISVDVFFRGRHAGVPAECVVSSAGVLHPLISLPQYSHALQNDAGQRSVHPLV